MSYDFVASMVRDNVGKSGKVFFRLYLLYFYLFYLEIFWEWYLITLPILAILLVTFGLAGFIFLAVTLIGLVKHGIGFLKFFVPSGVPYALLPILIPIEVISYFVRPISLSLRLFANMMAGHTMLKVFASFIVLLGFLGGWAPLLLVVVLTGFEIMIAVLQAYVFTILCCLYLNDALHLHH